MLHLAVAEVLYKKRDQLPRPLATTSKMMTSLRKKKRTSKIATSEALVKNLKMKTCQHSVSNKDIDGNSDDHGDDSESEVEGAAQESKEHQ